MEAGVQSPDDLSRREQRVRDEIRQLQDQRAAAMKEEISSLRKEREIALAKISTLQTQLMELKNENGALKDQRSDSAIVVRLAKTEQDLSREIALKNELKGKLKVATQHNGRLLIKVKKLENQLNRRPGKLLKGGGLALRSASLGHLRDDLDEEGVTDSDGDAGDNGETRMSNRERVGVEMSCESCQTDVVVFKAGECQTDRVDNLISTSTQTDTLEPTIRIRYAVPDNVRDALAEAQETISELRHQLADCQSTLMRRDEDVQELREEAEKAIGEKNTELLVEQEARDSLEAAYNKVCRRVKHLRAEAGVLRSGLEEFRLWSRRKLKALSEEMDICRVIYSLRNSLSQEQSVVDELAQKLAQQQKETSSAIDENQRLANQLQVCQKQRDEATTRARMLSDQLLGALQAKDEALLLVNRMQNRRKSYQGLWMEGMY